MIAPTSTAARRRAQAAVWSPTIAIALSTLAIGVAGLRGGDYPAQLFRALLWKRFGPSVWDNLWYAGHPTVTYSVLAPPLMALVGPFGVVALASIVATYTFTRLTIDLLPASRTTVANHLFAAAVLVNVVVGRATFALGLATALLALRAWHRGWIVAALAAAALATLTSPVAAALLVIVATGVALANRRSGSAAARTTRLRAVAIVVATSAPLAVTTAWFGGTGPFPFRGGPFMVSALTLIVIVVAIPGRVVRFIGAVGIVGALLAFLVPNGLGGNFVRLVQIVAVPVAGIAPSFVRRRLRAPLTMVVLVGLGWSLQPGIAAAVHAWGDGSVEARYHQPLVDQIKARNLDGSPIGRLDIPLTANHWESFYVAAEVPFARGWERQLDLARNPQLYDETLTPDRYHAWLLDNGVRWIAVADVPLDASGVVERRVVEEASQRGVGWLRAVWSNEHWRLFEVADYQPIVTLPARLVEQDADYVVIRSDRPGTVTIRYHYDRRLTISRSATIERDGAGWIVAHLPVAGEYRLAVAPPALLR